MTRALTILREAYGLVVDDGTLAVAALVWIAVVWASVTHLAQSPTRARPNLFSGLAVILVENVAPPAPR